MPAEADIHLRAPVRPLPAWIPACAGMTGSPDADKNRLIYCHTGVNCTPGQQSRFAGLTTSQPALFTTIVRRLPCTFCIVRLIDALGLAPAKNLG